MIIIIIISPNDAERLEIELRVWFEVLVRQPVEGDVHMRYLVIGMLVMTRIMTIFMMRVTMPPGGAGWTIAMGDTPSADANHCTNWN